MSERKEEDIECLVTIVISRRQIALLKEAINEVGKVDRVRRYLIGATSSTDNDRVVDERVKPHQVLLSHIMERFEIAREELRRRVGDGNKTRKRNRLEQSGEWTERTDCAFCGGTYWKCVNEFVDYFRTGDNGDRGGDGGTTDFYCVDCGQKTLTGQSETISDLYHHNKNFRAE